MTACAATSMASDGVPARRCGNANAKRGATAAINKTWCNTRTENNADENAQSGETKITSISTIAPQPARVLEDRLRATASAKAASIAISSGSTFQRVQRSAGIAAGPQ